VDAIQLPFPTVSGLIILLGWVQNRKILEMFTIGVR
jgi:hypothetical protein